MSEHLNGYKHHEKYGSVTTSINDVALSNIASSSSHARPVQFTQNLLQSRAAHHNVSNATKPPRSPFFRTMSPALTSVSAATSPLKERIPDTEEQADNGSTKINVWQAGFTIVNLFLGLCLLSYPYALASGSLSSLLVFVVICFALCYTGKLIVRCFDLLPTNNEHSYPMVGSVAFGKYGYYLICFGIVAELFGALCTNTIFLWTNVSYLLVPIGLSRDQAIIACIVVSLPTCWMLNFNELSIPSFLGCVCKIFTAIVVCVSFAMNFDTVQHNVASGEIDIWPQSIQSICIAIGIYVMSFSGHPCLPGIYRDMKHPEKFERMLDVCFGIMCASYVLISVFGYLTFGSDTNIIITGNLQTQNVYLSTTLISLVVLGCFFQVSPLIAVMAEIPENNLLKLRKQTNKSRWKARMFRTALFLCICLASYLSMDDLALIEAVTGSLCTMIVSVICPALFYHQLVLNSTPRKLDTGSSCKQGIMIHPLIQHSAHNDAEEEDGDTDIDRASPLFVAREPSFSPQPAVTNVEASKHWTLHAILYLYIIVGTGFGLYMFITDLMHALRNKK